jgi:hypothetical protein
VPSPIELARRVAALLGLAGLVLASAGWVARPLAFWHAYLFAWLLWASVTLGCALTATLARAIRRDLAVCAVLSAGTRTALLVAVLAVPLALDGSESATWIANAAAAQPIATAVRFVVVGPALAALALSIAVLAALSRREAAVLPVAAARALRVRLSALLTVDAALVLGQPLRASAGSTLLSSDRGSVVTLTLAAAEIGIATGLALSGRSRRLVAASVAACLAHAALVHRLMPPVAALPGDAAWVPHALDLLLVGAIGGLWLALFFWRLDRRPPPPLLPRIDDLITDPEGAAAKPARP